MRYSVPQYARALLSLVEETPEHRHREVMREFFKTLAAHGTLSVVEDIVREVGLLLDGRHGVRRVSVRSVLRESERAFRRKLHFTAAVSAVKDVRLGGGVVIERGDLRVDNSIARRLGRLREALVG